MCFTRNTQWPILGQQKVTYTQLEVPVNPEVSKWASVLRASKVQITKESKRKQKPTKEPKTPTWPTLGNKDVAKKLETPRWCSLAFKPKVGNESPKPKVARDFKEADAMPVATVAKEVKANKKAELVKELNHVNWPTLGNITTQQDVVKDEAPMWCHVLKDKRPDNSPVVKKELAPLEAEKKTVGSWVVEDVNRVKTTPAEAVEKVKAVKTVEPVKVDDEVKAVEQVKVATSVKEVKAVERVKELKGGETVKVDGTKKVELVHDAEKTKKKKKAGKKLRKAKQERKRKHVRNKSVWAKKEVKPVEAVASAEVVEPVKVVDKLEDVNLVKLGEASPVDVAPRKLTHKLLGSAWREALDIGLTEKMLTNKASGRCQSAGSSFCYEETLSTRTIGAVGVGEGSEPMGITDVGHAKKTKDSVFYLPSDFVFFRHMLLEKSHKTYWPSDFYKFKSWTNDKPQRALLPKDFFKYQEWTNDKHHGAFLPKDFIRYTDWTKEVSRNSFLPGDFYKFKEYTRENNQAVCLPKDFFKYQDWTSEKDKPTYLSRDFFNMWKLAKDGARRKAASFKQSTHKQLLPLPKGLTAILSCPKLGIEVILYDPKMPL